MVSRGTKRKSDETASNTQDAYDMAPQTFATKTASPAEQQASPQKKQKTGISLSQKQALIDNLQLEITERARKLRAQYNLQAQGLRMRIEIRVNRIPMALRKAKMGELADKYKYGLLPQQVKATPSHTVLQSTRPPPVPEKDTPLVRADFATSTQPLATASSRRPGPGQPLKRTSNAISGDSQRKRGQATYSETPRKKLRVDAENNASTVLSPSSANIQTQSRPMPAAKPVHVRAQFANENMPVPSNSPTKQNSVSNIFGSWAEKAGSPRKKASAAKMSSDPSSVRGRKPVTVSTVSTTKAAAAGSVRRISGISESSESGTSTVAKKGAEKKASPAKKARGVIGSIRRGVAGAVTKKAAEKKAAPASTATGRILRDRGLK